LARAWLISDLTEEDRAAAEGALLMQLDDASPLVRQAMAEVFARSSEAPAAIVQALSLDQASVALPVLEHSPLLIDADLVDIIATGNCEMQCAVARASICRRRSARRSPKSVAPRRRSKLIENAYAELRAVFMGSHRRAPRPSRGHPGSDAGAGRSAGRDAGALVAKAFGDADAIRLARNWLSAIARCGWSARRAIARP